MSLRHVFAKLTPLIQGFICDLCLSECYYLVSSVLLGLGFGLGFTDGVCRVFRVGVLKEPIQSKCDPSEKDCM